MPKRLARASLRQGGSPRQLVHGLSKNPCMYPGATGVVRTLDQFYRVLFRNGTRPVDYGDVADDTDQIGSGLVGKRLR